MKIFIVLPLFNEEKRIAEVLKEVIKYNLPIVVVDDGSRDDSFKVASKFKVASLRHKVNLGKGAAMKTGVDYAFSKGAEAIIFMDSDGQHNPSNLVSFEEKLNSKEYDVVLGSRNLSFGVPLVRYLGNKLSSLIIRFIFGIYVSDPICGFRALTKKAYGKITWETSGYGVETEMIARLGKSKLKYCEVPVETIYHDKVKGVTILDAFSILGEVVKWKLTI